MTGSKFTGYMENESGDLEQVIKLSKNKSGADKLIITYEEGKDTYSMRFIKSPKLNKKTFYDRYKPLSLHRRLSYYLLIIAVFIALMYAGL